MKPGNLFLQGANSSDYSEDKNFFAKSLIRDFFYFVNIL